MPLMQACSMVSCCKIWHEESYIFCDVFLRDITHEDLKLVKQKAFNEENDFKGMHKDEGKDLYIYNRVLTIDI